MNQLRGRRATAAAAIFREGASLFVAAPLWIWWALWEGGYPRTVWLPGIVYLAFATALLVRYQPRPPMERAALLALAALTALTVWSAVSLMWATDRGAAWTGAERTLLTLLAFAPPLLWPPTSRALVVGVLVWICAVAGAMVAGLLATLEAPAAFAREGRLVEPTGYANATAALALMGALPALVLASCPERSAVMRCVGVGVGGGLVASLLLSQSRGAIVAAAVVLAAAVLAGPGRLRLVTVVAMVAAVVWLLRDPLLDARTGARAGAADQAFTDALWTALAIVTTLVTAAAGYVALERRMQISAAAIWRLHRAAVAGGALLLTAGAISFGVTQGNPWVWAMDRVEDFQTPDYERLEQSESRFTGSLGSNRADYWRVALDLAAERPLTGFGVTNFSAPYLERRRADTAPLYAHSVWLQALADLGAPGAALLVSAFAAAAVAARQTRRRLSTSERGVQLAALLPAVYVVLHASADWVSFFPGLVVPATGLAAAAVRVGVPPPRRRPVLAPLGSTAVLIAVSAISVPTTALFLSARLTRDAATSWRAEPVAAFDRLELAQQLDPLSDLPALHEGIIAVEIGDDRRAWAAYREASHRQDNDWFAALMLGVLALAAGQPAAADGWLERAWQLNPRDRTLRQVAAAARRNDPVDPRSIQRAVLEQP